MVSFTVWRKGLSVVFVIFMSNMSTEIESSAPLSCPCVLKHELKRGKSSSNHETYKLNRRDWLRSKKSILNTNYIWMEYIGLPKPGIDCSWHKRNYYSSAYEAKHKRGHCLCMLLSFYTLPCLCLFFFCITNCNCHLILCLHYNGFMKHSKGTGTVNNLLASYNQIKQISSLAFNI